MQLEVYVGLGIGKGRKLMLGEHLPMFAQPTPWWFVTMAHFMLATLFLGFDKETEGQIRLVTCPRSTEWGAEPGMSGSWVHHLSTTPGCLLSMCQNAPRSTSWWGAFNMYEIHMSYLEREIDKEGELLEVWARKAQVTACWNQAQPQIILSNHLILQVGKLRSREEKWRAHGHRVN